MTAREYLMKDLHKPTFKVEKAQSELLCMREDMAMENSLSVEEKYKAEIADTMEYLTSLTAVDEVTNQPLGKREVFFTAETKASLLQDRKAKHIKTNWRALKRMKLNHIFSFSDKILNGYYSGFLASILCSTELHILDCFPCMEKRIYWIPSSKCKFCCDKEPYPIYDDYKSLLNIYKKPRDSIRHYIVTSF